MTCSYYLTTWEKLPDGSIDYSKPPQRCGKRVGWKMVKDDDQNTVRQYHPLCEEHQAVVDAQEDEDDDEAYPRDPEEEDPV